MNFKEQIYEYLSDCNHSLAAEIIYDSEFEAIGVPEIISDFEDIEVCYFKIMIRPIYHEKIDSELFKEKNRIENILIEFAKNDNKIIQSICWLPLPKVLWELKKDNRYQNLNLALEKSDFNTFFKIIQSILASVPYQLSINEAYFHGNLHTIFKTLGFEVESESSTNIGRIDTFIELQNKIIILEYKTSNADSALNQILERKYYQKFLDKGKKVYLIGVACSTKERNIVDWKIEQII